MAYFLKRVSAHRVGRWVVGDPGSRVVVLCYHSVHPAKRFSSVDPELFDLQLGWLKRNCEVISFRQVAEAARRVGAGIPSVAITFDDGYADNFEYALPLLEKHALTATFFLTVGLIEQDPSVVGRFQMLRRCAATDVKPLTWSEVRTMRQAGMEFGAHTYSHPNLANLGAAELAKELCGSKSMLEDRLGQAVDLLAYPFGKPNQFYTPDTVEAARTAGYRYAAAVLFRNVRATDSPLELPRFFVARDSVDTLREKVWGWWDMVGWWQAHLGWLGTGPACIDSPAQHFHNTAGDGCA